MKKNFPPKNKYLLLFGTLFWIIFLGSFFVVKGEDLSVTCNLTNVDKNCAALGPDKCQDLLKKCLNYYEEQSKLYENKLKENQSKRKSLQSTIYYLENKIKKLRNEIYQNNLMIKDLNYQIADTEIAIENTNSKIQDFRKRLAEILRTVYEKDQKFLIEILLVEDTISSFFDDLFALENLNLKTQELLEAVSYTHLTLPTKA